jgi:hypothetical protein
MDPRGGRAARAASDPKPAHGEFPFLQRKIGNRVMGRLLDAAPFAVPRLQRRCANCEQTRLQREAAGYPEHQHGKCTECERAAGGSAVQLKLAIGPAGDRYEQEADRVAEQVTRMLAPGISASPAPPQISPLSPGFDEREKLQENAAGAGEPGLDEAPASVHAVVRSAGRPLDGATRQFFESRFGRSFADVRIHTDAAAQASTHEIGAQAYTVGRNIVFASGQYAPETVEGRRLLAHEIAHVLQQSGGCGGPSAALETLRRQADAGQLAGAPTPPPAAGEQPVKPAPPSAELEPQAPPGGTLARPEEPAAGNVQRMVFSCADMRLSIETGSVARIYKLETCSLPIGSYEARIRIEGNDFYLTFPPEVSRDQRFDFTYRVEPGQENPARLLAGQSSVHVEVVEHLPAPTPQPQPPQPACVAHFGDRQLVAPGSASRDLFKPLSIDHNILLARIPLGEFGFVDANLNASGRLSGTLSGRNDRGMLTDICLTHLIGSMPSSAPIEHPLLGRGSRADVTTFAVGGRARFKLPASATASIVGTGKLTISGDFLGLFELAAIEGGLTARGDASLSGSFDAMVEIVVQFTRSSATLRAPLLPIEVVISNSSLDKLDLAAEAALRGHASLAFGLDATAGVRVVGVELWRESWRLRKEAGLGIGWAGGIKYSPNPGIHWILGAIGKLEGIDDLVSDDEDEADVETDDVLDTLLNQAQGSVTAPDGLSPRTALPFDWHKPIEIYPATLAIPNADDPHALSRDAGPTTVRFTQGGRSVFERIGVSRGNWPFQGKRFQFVPPAGRVEPEKDRLRALLDRLGFDRSGTDVDHVHELQFGGADAFNNLWPADNSANRSAGARHAEQLENYRQQPGLANLAGRHFVISRVRI